MVKHPTDANDPGFSAVVDDLGIDGLPLPGPLLTAAM